MNKLNDTFIVSNFPKKDKEIRTKWWYWLPVGASFVVCLIGIAILGYIVAGIPDRMEYYSQPTELKAEPIKQIVEVIPVEIEVIEEDLEPIPEPEPIVHLTDDDIMAAVAMSEAGNQDVLGMAFVIMTVLNRCDYYDATVESIVTAPNQYAYPYYGKISDNAYRAIKLAREYRNTFPPIAWFQTGDYPAYGEPAFKWGDHYFSYLEESEG